eukprot:gene10135-1830_t
MWSSGGVTHPKRKRLSEALRCPSSPASSRPSSPTQRSEFVPSGRARSSSADRKSPGRRSVVKISASKRDVTDLDVGSLPTHLLAAAVVRLSYNGLRSLDGLQLRCAVLAACWTHGPGTARLMARASRPQPALCTALPHGACRAAPRPLQRFAGLESLSLAHNRVDDFAELAHLLSPCLKHVTLMGNPLDHHPNYRHEVLSRLPTLKSLDSQEITQGHLQDLQDAKVLSTVLLPFMALQAEIRRYVDADTARIHLHADLMTFFIRTQQVDRLVDSAAWGWPAPGLFTFCAVACPHQGLGAGRLRPRDILAFIERAFNFYPAHHLLPTNDPMLRDVVPAVGSPQSKQYGLQLHAQILSRWRALTPEEAHVVLSAEPLGGDVEVWGSCPEFLRALYAMLADTWQALWEADVSRKKAVDMLSAVRNEFLAGSVLYLHQTYGVLSLRSAPPTPPSPPVVWSLPLPPEPTRDLSLDGKPSLPFVGPKAPPSDAKLSPSFGDPGLGSPTIAPTGMSDVPGSPSAQSLHAMPMDVSECVYTNVPEEVTFEPICKGEPLSSLSPASTGPVDISPESLQVCATFSVSQQREALLHQQIQMSKDEEAHLESPPASSDQEALPSSVISEALSSFQESPGLMEHSTAMMSWSNLGIEPAATVLPAEAASNASNSSELPHGTRKHLPSDSWPSYQQPPFKYGSPTSMPHHFVLNKDVRSRPVDFTDHPAPLPLPSLHDISPPRLPVNTGKYASIPPKTVDMSSVQGERVHPEDLSGHGPSFPVTANGVAMSPLPAAPVDAGTSMLQSGSVMATLSARNSLDLSEELPALPQPCADAVDAQSWPTGPAAAAVVCPASEPSRISHPTSSSSTYSPDQAGMPASCNALSVMQAGRLWSPPTPSPAPLTTPVAAASPAVSGAHSLATTTESLWHHRRNVAHAKQSYPVSTTEEPKSYHIGSLYNRLQSTAPVNHPHVQTSSHAPPIHTQTTLPTDSAQPQTNAVVQPIHTQTSPACVFAATQSASSTAQADMQTSPGRVAAQTQSLPCTAQADMQTSPGRVAAQTQSVPFTSQADMQTSPGRV